MRPWIADWLGRAAASLVGESSAEPAT